MTAAAAPPPDPIAQQQLLLVTGLSGAGKSTALDVLEDCGWETIDNFPVRLLKRLVAMPEEPRGPLAIVMGSEQYGLSEFWMKGADVLVRIPMAGQADSLNVAMATIITLFEAVRQRHG